MKISKITFTLSLLGILVLIVLTQFPETRTGTIESVQFSNNKITIQIENFEPKLILFDTSFINLKKGDEIRFQGKHDIYKKQEQIIVSKILIKK